MTWRPNTSSRAGVASTSLPTSTSSVRSMAPSPLSTLTGAHPVPGEPIIERWANDVGFGTPGVFPLPGEKAYRESEHPRDAQGQWTETLGGPSKPKLGGAGAVGGFAEEGRAAYNQDIKNGLGEVNYTPEITDISEPQQAALNTFDRNDTYRPMQLTKRDPAGLTRELHKQ